MKRHVWLNKDFMIGYIKLMSNIYTINIKHKELLKIIPLNSILNLQWKLKNLLKLNIKHLVIKKLNKIYDINNLLLVYLRLKNIKNLNNKNNLKKLVILYLKKII